MARINFEDDIEAQDEFWDLLPLVGGDRERALGKLVLFFRLAQKAYGHNKPMTKEELIEKHFEVMIESGWAVPVEGGYHALGAAKHFGWYRQKCDSGKIGGQARANAPRDESGRFTSNPHGTQADSTRTPPETQPVATPLAPALSLAPVKIQNKESIGSTDATPPAVSPGKPPPKSKWDQATRGKARIFATAYVKAYQTRFPDGRPEDLNDGATQGQILNWIKDYPIDRACALIQTYFQMETKWFGTKGYDFETFRRNLNKIGQALDSGKDPDGNAINWQGVKLA